VISACSFCLWLVLLSLPLIQSFVTSLLGIEGSNLLVTCSVISSFSFSLNFSFFSSTVAFSCARSSSSWDSQRLSRSFVTGWVGERSICSSDFHCDFCLLLFRVRYFFFLFLFRSSSSSLSYSSSAMVSIAGGAATEDSADPKLIASFSVQ
jgi:hypothetical protein